MPTGKMIKELRMHKGITQTELGELLGVKKSAIQKYESGAITNYKIDTIKKLCELFNITPYTIIYGYGENLTMKKLIKLSEMWNTNKKYVNFIVTISALSDDSLNKLYAYANDLAALEKYRGCDNDEKQ